MSEQEAADARWKKRVSIRVLNGKIIEAKKWLNTDNGQMTLVGIFVILTIIAGAAEKL